MVQAPSITTRSQWRAEAATGQIRGMPSYTHIVVHHAAGNFATTLSEGKRQVANIQRFHQKNRGWIDIGYHFLIDAGGNIYQGRTFKESKPLAQKPTLALGAHVRNQNSGKIGVCLLGCYHPPAVIPCNDVLTSSATDALVTLISFLCDAYGIPPSKIKGHRDFLNTSCPGNILFAELSKIRRRVREGLRS